MRINAITYKSLWDQKRYVSEAREVSAIGVEKSVEKAESELVKAVQCVLDEHRRDTRVQLRREQSWMFNMLESRVDFRKRPDRTKAIPGHEAELRIYDHTKYAHRKPK